VLCCAVNVCLTSCTWIYGLFDVSRRTCQVCDSQLPALPGLMAPFVIQSLLVPHYAPKLSAIPRLKNVECPSLGHLGHLDNFRGRGQLKKLIGQRGCLSRWPDRAPPFTKLHSQRQALIRFKAPQYLRSRRWEQALRSVNGARPLLHSSRGTFLVSPGIYGIKRFKSCTILHFSYHHLLSFILSF
jgi:hypothetical protein